MMEEYGHGWAMGWWWIIGLIILFGVIWILLKSFNRNATTNKESRKSALDILNERYAKGEIDKTEYEELKKDLV